MSEVRTEKEIFKADDWSGGRVCNLDAEITFSGWD